MKFHTYKGKDLSKREAIAQESTFSSLKATKLIFNIIRQLTFSAYVIKNKWDNA